MTDTFRWRLAIGAALVASGYAAWLVIPRLGAFLGATPLLTKLIAVVLLGRPTIDFLKKHSFKLFRRSMGGDD